MGSYSMGRGRAKAVSLSALMLGLAAGAGWADVKVATAECSITFGSGWTLLDTSELVLANNQGLGGIAIVRSARDNNSAPFDLAAEAKAVGDSLEAKMTLTKNETKTIGSYQVGIFTLDYDTLRRVERVAAANGKANTFRNGSLRAYVVRSGGTRVNIIGVPVVSLLTPYAGIEQAIPSLAMTPISALRPAAPAFAGWSVSGGRLRFAGEAPREVSARDARGRELGLAKASGAEWVLPSGRHLYLMARYADGRSAALGPWNGRP